MSEPPLEPHVAASAPELVSPGSRASRQATQTKLEVLVVDDDQDTGEGLARLIRSFGYGCRIAADGDEALRVMAEGHTNAVISDWDMPGMSGAELCKRTRTDAADASYTYFIFLTGFDDREHRLAGMAAGADDYQKKPVDIDALEARLVAAARVVELHRRLATRLAEAMRATTCGACDCVRSAPGHDA